MTQRGREPISLDSMPLDTLLIDDAPKPQNKARKEVADIGGARGGGRGRGAPRGRGGFRAILQIGPQREVVERDECRLN
ncbi:hypothetical protein LSUE1_G007907 [Lachnellula suecica]|uniref:Uncharacterized protein n=1 Tax=Lachnellula suecica TaxID=602035 RepID=A0A8T9BUG8_9HELO|nr:hypothetical protein LSUE1_G007907 [Lachnellula suecica]